MQLYLKEVQTFEPEKNTQLFVYNYISFQN